MNKDIQRISSTPDEDTLFEQVSALIDEARRYVRNTVDTTMTYTYFFVGKYIVECEQKGSKRAEYGQQVLRNLSIRLNNKYEGGWSYPNLKKIRQFYLTYSKRINSVYPIQVQKDKQCLSNSAEPAFKLGWSQYLELMRIENEAERNFYEVECAQQNWTVRQLDRQIKSCLYERLVLSRDKEKARRLSDEGQTIESPEDIIKSPVALEFLGLRVEEAYSESKLENAIISKMQNFLLEMGKGFLFEARQKRFTFNNDNFYVDLVLYNRLLQCYVLIDLKIDKLTHQDLGQMQMYVNYYDRYVKQDFEKPTIGILLCKQKNDALVELTLPQDANIYASAYQLCLPDKALLQAKVKEWIEEFEECETERKALRDLNEDSMDITD
jgi:predicted nuclease of restriction endonuclease-like (RecB) superfamily